MGGGGSDVSQWGDNYPRNANDSWRVSAAVVACGGSKQCTTEPGDVWLPGTELEVCRQPRVSEAKRALSPCRRDE